MGIWRSTNNALLLPQPNVVSCRLRWASNGLSDPSHRDGPGPICRRRHFIFSSPSFPWSIDAYCLVGWHARIDLSHWCLRTFEPFHCSFISPTPSSLLPPVSSSDWGWCFLMEWAGQVQSTSHSVTWFPQGTNARDAKCCTLPTSYHLGGPRAPEPNKNQNVMT